MHPCTFDIKMGRHQIGQGSVRQIPSLDGLRGLRLKFWCVSSQYDRVNPLCLDCFQASTVVLHTFDTDRSSMTVSKTSMQIRGKSKKVSAPGQLVIREGLAQPQAATLGPPMRPSTNTNQRTINKLSLLLIHHIHIGCMSFAVRELQHASIDFKSYSATAERHQHQVRVFCASSSHPLLPLLVVTVMQG